jgi:hypothetical protein
MRFAPRLPGNVKLRTFQKLTREPHGVELLPTVMILRRIFGHYSGATLIAGRRDDILIS